MNDNRRTSPLSQSQLGIYIESTQHEGEGPQIYHNPSIIYFEGVDDAERLADAIRAFIAGSPGISARIGTDADGNPLLEDYSKTDPVKVEVREISDRKLHAVKEHLMEPFDLEGGPLAHFIVFKTEMGVYLYFDVHHAIYDGSSQISMLRKIDRLYRGEEVAPETLTIFDIADREAEERKSPRFSEAKAAYAALLEGADTDIAPLPDVKGVSETEYEAVTIPLGVKAGDFRRWCKERRLSQSSVTSGAMGVVLHSFSRKDHFSFATIYHGRHSAEEAEVCGMMVRTLPVRVDITPDTDIASLLEATGRNLAIAKDNDIYSFADAAQDFGVNSDFLFAYQGNFMEAPDVNGPAHCTFLPKPATGSRISLNLYIQDDSMLVIAEYRKDLYSRRFAEALVSSYDCVLQAIMTSDSSVKTSALPLLSPAALAECLAVGDGGKAAADPADTLVTLFRRSAEKYPDHTAIVYNDRRLTYAELDRISDSLALLLRDKYGVGEGSRVGVLIDRSELMAIYPLAVMKAGGAYMPLDPHFPEERLMFMIEDAGVRTILEESGLAARTIPSFKGDVIPDSVLAGLAEASEKIDFSRPDTPMVVLYTSGSTGKPKGVTLQQHGVVNYAVSYCGLTGLTDADRTGAYAAFGFDAHMMDLYPALTAGAEIHIFNPEMRLDLTAMHQYMETNKLTSIFMTTQIAWQMATLFDYSSLRVMSAGGEKLPPIDKLPFDFYNLYGPTECSIASTAYKVEGPTDGTIIGRTLRGQQIRIVDTDLRCLPQGVAGELIILGAGVGEGYLNRTDLTAAKFIEIDGERAYRTGDQARFTGDGQIEYLGRMDGMVKLRGLRIELGEIENVAVRHPAVKTFVAAVKEIGGMENLVGYYTCKENEHVSPEDLQAFMGNNLTEFMIPSSIMEIEKMPLTPNGKVDRRALPVPEAAAACEIVAPETDMERRLFDIVAAILKHDRFGVTTNLLGAGLTSLMAMRLVASIMKELNIAVKAKQVMSQPTVREIAHLLEGSEQPAQRKSAASAGRLYYPLTENQRGVYIDWEMNRDALQYNIPQAFSFAPGTDPERLRQAVLRVVEAHPGLMTRLVMRNGDVMQKRSEGEMPEITVTRLEQKPDAAFFASRLRPFDLLGESLFRCEIFLHGDDVYMLRDTHHIIYDGVSAVVFTDELRRAYNGETPEREVYSALDFAVDEKERLESAEADKAAEWFGRLVEGTESTSYPKSAKPDNDIAGGMGRLSLRMPAAAIRDFCKRGGITPSNYLLAAFLQLLHRLTREENIQITTVNNGRNDIRLLSDTGMFVKTLPVVSRCKKPEGTPLEFAGRVQEQFLTTQDYDFFPFTTLVEKYGIRPDIMYVFEGGLDAGADNVTGLNFSNIVLPLDTAKVPLTLLVFEPSEEEYELVAEYDTSMYGEADMRVLLDMMSALSSSLTEAVSIRDGRMITPEREEQLKEIRNGVKIDVPYRSFHGAMEVHADKNPDAPALVACDKSLTYGEFDREANRIANALRKRGVETGDRIVILLPRRSSLITAIYGTMKAGATYIPCDPEYPAERIRLITEDSGARYIITTADRVALYPGKALDIEELLQETDDSRTGVEVGPDDIAYMIYTSGSTGRPKGVMIHQHAITNYLYGYWYQYYREHPEIKTQMLIVTISFDASLQNLGIPLTSGQTLVLANEEECKDVTLLSKLMLDNHVDSFDITPSRLDAMLELPDFREAVSRAKLINIGGEGFGIPLIQKIFDTGFDGLAVNEYGPTETTVGSNNIALRPDSAFSAGRPFFNDWNRIVDAWGGELPVGAVGELYIFGRGVGKGYNNLPEKTAEAYVDFHGERGYRTGDLARWTPDGNVVILGRIDHQVKLRGLRIELGEIENVAKTFGGVTAAAADVREINKVQHLCLYYTAATPVDKSALREYLAERLTDYMVPDSYTEIGTMPLTPNGKTNRKALPDPELTPVTEYAEPVGDIEKDICDAYAKILHLERVGANDDFFAIGGTSISAIKVVAALANAGHNISYKNVFANRTPRQLAALIAGSVTEPTPAPQIIEMKEKTVSAYADVLDTNTLDLYLHGKHQQTGTVLLTGATGFMGIHMLHELIAKGDRNIYCVLRGKGDISAESRLRTLLFYYFDETFESEFESGRIRVIEGDVTRPVPEGFCDEHIDTVINCAANVKHFSAGNDIELVNVESVRNLIEYCLKEGSRLVHISTTSIAGESVNGLPDPATLLTEHMFDFGQNLSNQYAHSKYEAERLILEAIRDRGLSAKIMRVGNLSARASDGEFQINFRTNAFMGRLKAFVALGCAPYDMLDAPCEFSPIDEVVRAILLLATTPEGMNVFHPTNNHSLPLGDVLHILDGMGLKVKPVENPEFDAAKSEAMDDPDKADALQPLLAYNSDENVTSSFIGYDARYTNQILYRLGFYWNYTSREYVVQFLKAIEALNFFA